MSVYLPAWILICLSVCLPAWVCLFVYLRAFHSPYIFVCLPDCDCLYLFVSPPTCLSVLAFFLSFLIFLFFFSRFPFLLSASDAFLTGEQNSFRVSLLFNSFLWHSLFTANLELRNPHLPSINGYTKTNDGPKSAAITSYNSISSESAITTATIGMLTVYLSHLRLRTHIRPMLEIATHFRSRS